MKSILFVSAALVTGARLGTMPLKRRLLRAAADIERRFPEEYPEGTLGAEWRRFAANLRRVAEGEA